MSRPRKNCHLLDARHERSGKTLRRCGNHSVRQAPHGRHPGPASRAARRARPRRNLRQSGRALIRRTGGQIMSFRNIGIVYRKELREALRDRRTVIASVVIPLFLFPLLSVGLFTLIGSIVNKTGEASPKVMVIGGDDSPGVLAALRATPRVEIVAASPNWKDLVVEKEIPIAVEIPAEFDKRIADQKKLEVFIYKYTGELKSETAAGKLNDSLRTYRENVVKNRVVAQKLPVEVLDPFQVTQKNVAPAEKSGAALFFGGFIAYIVVFLCFNGGMHPAIDLTAGEKERGTMETILSSPIARSHLVIGKFLLVFTTALSTAALSVISMGISFALVHAFQV